MDTTSTRVWVRRIAGSMAMAALLSPNLPAWAQPATSGAPAAASPSIRSLVGGEFARKEITELMRMSRGGILDKDLVHACGLALQAAAWGDVEAAISFQALTAMLSGAEQDQCKADARSELTDSDIAHPRLVQSPRTVP